MRFAAGITLSGIGGLILLEVYKLIGPWVQGMVLGILVFVLKAVLILLVLFFAATVLGVGFYFYKRGERAGVEV